MHVLFIILYVDIKMVVVPKCLFLHMLPVDIAISVLVEMGLVRRYVVHIMNLLISSCMFSHVSVPNDIPLIIIKLVELLCSCYQNKACIHIKCSNWLKSMVLIVAFNDFTSANCNTLAVSINYTIYNNTECCSNFHTCMSLSTFCPTKIIQ